MITSLSQLDPEGSYTCPAAWFFVWQLERKLRHTFKAEYAVPQSDQEYFSLRHFLDRVDEVVKTIQAIEQKSSADMPSIAKSLVKLKPLFIRERQAIVAALNSIERTAVVGDDLLHLIPEAELWATRSKGYQYRF